MGIAEVQELVDSGQPVSPEQIAASDAEHIENAYKDRSTRIDIEDTFAKEAAEIEAKYAKSVENAATRRTNAHKKNRDKHSDALADAGLNPNGSDPRGRPQDVL